MLPIKAAGIHRSHVRCYSVGFAETAAHYISTATFNRFQDVVTAASFFNKPGPTGQKALVFVAKDHLPEDLRLQIPHSLGFFEFIAFTSALHLLMANAQRLPLSMREANCSYLWCDGFAVTNPVQKINPYDSMSFTEMELRPFLGEQHADVGAIIVLNLANQTSEHPSLPAAARTIAKYSACLRQG
jgi:hypothetical protein